jgi:hypothetical protein
MAGLGRWHGVFTSRAQRRATRQNLHVLTTPEHDMPLPDSVTGRHALGGALQASAAVTLDAPAQERPARAQPSAQPSAQRTAPSGWWLIPAVVVGAAIWGLIIWWLL